MKKPKTRIQKPKVALIHDYLREYGGAERVLETLHEMYPEAPVYVAFTDQKSLGSHWQKFADWDLRTTWMQEIPFIKKLYSPLRFLAPHAFASLDLSDYDLVISSSNAYYAKAVQVPNGEHVCYCHTPPRSLYGYSTMSDWKKNPLIRIFGEIINHYLRMLDFEMAQKVDLFIANSEETKRRIQKFYRREAEVVFPPVEIKGRRQKAEGRSRRQEYFLYVNRLAFAKHPELAVGVCSKNNWPLKVIGTGKILPELKEMAGKSVEFLGSVSDEELVRLYAGAKALLYPVEDEDFGMVPVEAMLSGVPVIAHRSGGPKETIVDGKTGVFFDELTEDGLESAVRKFEKLKFKKTELKKQGSKFSKEEFVKKIGKVINSSLGDK